MITLCFLCFKTWSCIAKLSFYDKYKEIYMILGYNNRRPVAMAAILNKKLSSAWIFGVGIQVTFLKISAFYIFSRSNPNAPGLIHLSSKSKQRVISLLVIVTDCQIIVKCYRNQFWFSQPKSFIDNNLLSENSDTHYDIRNCV